MEIKGRDLVAGVPQDADRSTRDEIREALAEPVNAIVEAVRVGARAHAARAGRPTSSTAASCSPAAARSCKNLDVLLREETGLPVMVSREPAAARSCSAPARRSTS